MRSYEQLEVENYKCVGSLEEVDAELKAKLLSIMNEKLQSLVITINLDENGYRLEINATHFLNWDFDFNA